MQNRDDEMPEPTRSPSEIEFLLRDAKRKTGPAVLRDLARAESEAAPAPKREKSPGPAARRSKTII